jgi:hypothetical protein
VSSDDAVVLSLPANANRGAVPLVGSGGPAVMVVSGGTATVQE